MHKTDVTAGVRRSWAFLKEQGIGELVRQIEPLAVNEEYRKAALGGAASYSELYKAAMQTASYNIMLRDFSLLQFGWFDTNDVRYAFLPNPSIRFEISGEIVKEAWSLVDAGAASVEEALMDISSVESENGAPLLRYENSEKQRKELRHPCSHFHIGFHSENRWPLARVLTPFAFTLLVSKFYYSEHWLKDCSETAFGQFEATLIEERRDGCRLLPPEMFSQLERVSFHIA